MRKLFSLLVVVLITISLAGCAGYGVETDWPAAIMVDGQVYLKSGIPMPAEIDESAIIGKTTAYTDTYPDKDGETNFSRELGLPYARVEDGIAILIDNEWYLCTLHN